MDQLTSILLSWPYRLHNPAELLKEKIIEKSMPFSGPLIRRMEEGRWITVNQHYKLKKKDLTSLEKALPHFPENRRDLIQSAIDDLKHKKYAVVIYWSQEDKSYVADVPELPGCVAIGTTYEKTLKNAQVAIGEWLATAHREGRPIPEPKGKKLVYA